MYHWLFWEVLPILGSVVLVVIILYQFAIFNSFICCYLLFLTNWKSLLHGGDFDSSKFQEKRVAAYNFQLLDLNWAVRLHSTTPFWQREERPTSSYLTGICTLVFAVEERLTLASNSWKWVSSNKYCFYCHSTTQYKLTHNHTLIQVVDWDV